MQYRRNVPWDRVSSCADGVMPMIGFISLIHLLSRYGPCLREYREKVGERRATNSSAGTMRGSERFGFGYGRDPQDDPVRGVLDLLDIVSVEW